MRLAGAVRVVHAGQLAKTRVDLVLRGAGREVEPLVVVPVAILGGELDHVLVLPPLLGRELELLVILDLGGMRQLDLRRRHRTQSRFVAHLDQAGHDQGSDRPGDLIGRQRHQVAQPGRRRGAVDAREQVRLVGRQVELLVEHQGVLAGPQELAAVDEALEMRDVLVPPHCRREQRGRGLLEGQRVAAELLSEPEDVAALDEEQPRQQRDGTGLQLALELQHVEGTLGDELLAVEHGVRLAEQRERHLVGLQEAATDQPPAELLVLDVGDHRANLSGLQPDRPRRVAGVYVEAAVDEMTHQRSEDDRELSRGKRALTRNLELHPRQSSQRSARDQGEVLSALTT